MTRDRSVGDCQKRNSQENIEIGWDVIVNEVIDAMTRRNNPFMQTGSRSCNIAGKNVEAKWGYNEK